MDTPKLTPLRMLVRYLSPYKGRMALLGTLVVLSLTLQLINPQLIRYFIDSAENRSGFDRLIGAAAIFTALTIVQQIALLAATYVGEVVGWMATNRLRVELALHCMRLDLAFHKTHTPGELIERVDGDVNQLARFFSQLVLQLVGNVLLFTGVIVILWFEGWQIGLAVTLLAAVSVIVLEALRKRMVPRWQRVREADAQRFGYLEERLNGLEDIRANGSTDYVMNGFYAQLRNHWHIMRHAMRLNMFVISFPIWVFGLAFSLAHLVGGHLLVNGAVTIGGLYLIFHYINLMEGPLWATLDQIEELQRALSSIGRIADLFNVRPTLHDGPGVSMPKQALAVEFDNVSFCYEDDVENVLTDLSLRLEPGTVVGLLGRTGSGKSTLSKLLFRFYDPTQGSIRMGDGNGHMFDLRSAQRADLAGSIGMVTQEVQIFSATLRDNLTLFDDTISDARILAAVERVGLSDWLDAQPHGLDTLVDGGSLSAGEAQLLAFARVFLTEPGLVILDEASSRLDPATEGRIERALDGLFQERTGIIIAHRLATVQRADQIVILDHGRILEHGDRVALAADPHSRFSHLLRVGLESEE